MPDPREGWGPKIGREITVRVGPEDRTISGTCNGIRYYEGQTIEEVVIGDTVVRWWHVVSYRVAS